jgi:hypothetical protein
MTAKKHVLDEAEEGVIIAKTYKKRPQWFRVLLGVPLIYVPILVTLPFVIIGVNIVRLHLTALGARNMKKYWDFVPERISHRYNMKNQPRYSKNPFSIAYSRFFWIFNCTVYCPMSIALLRYFVYLVKIVENWWCPFEHSRKHEYADATIDASFWHINKYPNSLLHPDDRDNPIWNAEVRKKQASKKKK